MGYIATAGQTSRYRRPGLLQPVASLYYAAGAVTGLLQGLFAAVMKYTLVGRVLLRLRLVQAPKQRAPEGPFPEVNHYYDASPDALPMFGSSPKPFSAVDAADVGYFSILARGIVSMSNHQPHLHTPSQERSSEPRVETKQEPEPRAPRPRRPSVRSFPVEFEEDLDIIDEEADVQPQVDWGLRKPPLSPLSPPSQYKLLTGQTPSKLAPIPASPSGSYTSAASTMTGDIGFDVFRSPELSRDRLEAH